MSATARAALAAAANTVTGITCSPYFKSTTRPGDAMVRLDRVTFPNRFGGLVTWQVIVLLPQDVLTAEKQLDTKLPELTEALGQEMTVTSVSPQQLALDTGNVPCVVIEGTRETE